MKKWIVISIAFIGVVCVVIFVFFNSLHYPPLPMESITPKEAIKKLDVSDQKIVEISKDSDVIWYIINNNEDVNKIIEQFMSDSGWILKEIDGNSLFFEKGNETLIVSKQMWTAKYRLVKIPVHYKND